MRVLGEALRKAAVLGTSTLAAEEKCVFHVTRLFSFIFLGLYPLSRDEAGARMGQA